MDEQHGMIALIPESFYLTNIEFPHCTLVYLGRVEKQTHKRYLELLGITSGLATITRSFTAKAIGYDTFGPTEDRVKVLKLERNPELHALRSFVERFNKSEFKEFRPHITLGSWDTEVYEHPNAVRFNRLALCWGESRTFFRLK